MVLGFKSLGGYVLFWPRDSSISEPNAQVPKRLKCRSDIKKIKP